MPRRHSPTTMTAAQDLSIPFLSAVIEHVAHPIFVKNREFRFVLVNRAFCEMAGYAREDMIGKTDYDFFPKAESDFFRAKDVEMFSTAGAVAIEEEPITDADGVLHILATTKEPLLNEAGEVSHLVGIIHDITTIKKAETALRRHQEELELRVAERTAELIAAQQKLLRQERLSVLGELAGGLAHQLRNPLGAILNAAAVLRKAQLDGDQRQALDIIDEEVGRSDLTIRALLDYSRVRPPERREVLLRDVVEEALETQQVPAGIRVEVVSGLDITAAIDPLQVQTAVGNILRNAVEAMPEGGRLAVETRREDETATIIIWDTGAGVDDATRARLFDPLVTTKAEGNGLGLSTARNLIESHGGTIRYAPRAGGGAEFTVELPVKQPPEDTDVRH
jgi:PAS domain S-box-containing protein